MKSPWVIILDADAGDPYVHWIKEDYETLTAANLETEISPGYRWILHRADYDADPRSDWYLVADRRGMRIADQNCAMCGKEAVPKDRALWSKWRTC